MSKKNTNTKIKLDSGLPEIEILNAKELIDPVTNEPMLYTYYFVLKNKPEEVYSALVSLHLFSKSIQINNDDCLGRLVTRFYKTINVDLGEDEDKSLWDLREKMNVGQDSFISMLHLTEKIREDFPHRFCDEMTGNVVIGTIMEIEVNEENLEDMKNFKETLPWLGSSSLPSILEDFSKF